MNLMGTDGRDYFARMATLSESLNNAKLELRAAEQSRDALKRELAGEEPVFLPETPRHARGADLGAGREDRIAEEGAR